MLNKPGSCKVEVASSPPASPTLNGLRQSAVSPKGRNAAAASPSASPVAGSCSAGLDPGGGGPSAQAVQLRSPVPLTAQSAPAEGSSPGKSPVPSISSCEGQFSAGGKTGRSPLLPPRWIPATGRTIGSSPVEASTLQGTQKISNGCCGERESRVTTVSASEISSFGNPLAAPGLLAKSLSGAPICPPPPPPHDPCCFCKLVYPFPGFLLVLPSILFLSKPRNCGRMLITP